MNPVTLDLIRAVLAAGLFVFVAMVAIGLRELWKKRRDERAKWLPKSKR